MSESVPAQRVFAAVIQREGLYLVCRRPAHKRHGLLWEFPGGKLEPGESHFDAAYRELKEELNLRVSDIGERLFSFADPGSTFLVEFFPTVVAGSPELLEHCELRWVSLADMEALELAPTDKRFSEFLRGK